MPNSTTETPSAHRSEADQVGTQDLFHDEDVESARRFSDSDVPCHLDVIPVAFHAFDLVFLKAEIAREFRRRQARALKNAMRDRPKRKAVRHADHGEVFVLTAAATGPGGRWCPDTICGVVEAIVVVGRPLPGNRNDCRAWSESGAKAAVGNTRTIADGGYPDPGLVMPHRRRTGEDPPDCKQAHNKSHKQVRARVKHVFARMKTGKILRDCRPKGDGVQHAMHGIARLHHPTLTA